MGASIVSIAAFVVLALPAAAADLDEGVEKAARLIGSRDAAEAKKVLEPLAAAYPKSAKVQYLLAQAAILERDFSRAQKHLQKTVELDPANCEARIVLAAALRRNKKAAEASAQLAEVLKRDKANVDAMKAMAEIEHDAKRWEKAAGWYAKAFAARKDDASLAALIAVEWTEAVKALRDSPGKKRDDCADRALAALKDVGKLKPDLDDVLFNAGTVEVLAERWEDAIRDLKAFLEKKPGDGRGAYNLAIALERGGHPREAAGAWKRFIEIAEKEGGALKSDVPKARERMKACEREAKAPKSARPKTQKKKPGEEGVPKVGL